MSLSPSVSIVILNWNNTPDTIACVNSVNELDYDNFQVIVVDNGSTDGSPYKIRASHPEINLIETRANLGYAEGNNVGITYAVELGVDYIFVLNNDTLVDPTMLTKLVQLAETDSKIGMVGPLMYCIDPKDALFATGSFINWAKGQTRNRNMFQPAKSSSHLNRPEQVDFITGCGVLVRRELIEAIGALDPIYYLNFEDIEWGVRARQHGFEVWYMPQAVMWHKVSATLGRASAANTYYMTRNSLLFFWQNAPTHMRWLSVLSIVFRTLRTVGSWSLNNQYKTEEFQRLRQANLLALRDFFLRRFGQMGQDVASICYPNR